MDVISLFSGAGGLDLGFINAGHTIVWANDFDRDSVSTYKSNIGSHIVHSDICEISSSTVPDADVLIGGFPCQGFSQANMKRAVDDPRNGLYREFVRILTAKKPKFFVAENVKGLLSLGDGSAFEAITKGFIESGYRVTSQVLNAADYGVPQNRKRLIFLGVRSDLPENITINHPAPTHSSIDDALPDHISISDALTAVPDPDIFPSSVPNQKYSRYKITERNFTGHRRTDPNRPSPTILARGNGGGGVTAIPHPNGIRRLSVRESAAIQTFPLNYEFIGSLGSTYRQVGNAVPVLLAQRIADEVSNANSLLNEVENKVNV